MLFTIARNKLIQPNSMKKVKKYINRQGRMRDSTGPSLGKDCHLTSRGIDKREKFHAFFASVFSINEGP